jgi:hypothetical protein
MSTPTKPALSKAACSVVRPKRVVRRPVVPQVWGSMITLRTTAGAKRSLPPGTLVLFSDKLTLRTLDEWTRQFEAMPGCLANLLRGLAACKEPEEFKEAFDFFKRVCESLYQEIEIFKVSFAKNTRELEAALRAILDGLLQLPAKHSHRPAE